MTVFEWEVLVAQLARLESERASEPSSNPAPVDPTVPGSGLADQIELLGGALRRAVIAHPDTYGRETRGYSLAAVGTTVEVDDGTKRCSYRLSLGVDARDVGDVLAVSAFSPVGAALMGSAVGDVVEVVLPGGRNRSLEVISIVDDA